MSPTPFIALLLSVGFLCAQALTVPVVGAIDYYGFNKVQRETIRKIVNVKEGDRFPSSKAEAEERILQNGGVAEAHLEAVCCSDGKLILYIGIEERGGAHFDVREPPEGESILPEEVTTAYQQYRGALENAAHNGITSEDLTQGYSLSADPDVRALQQKFPALVKKYSGALREVLRSSFDENQRMAAVTLLAYNATRREAVTDLQTALRDADPSVRAAAAQALVAQAVFSKMNPQERLAVQPTWFVEMLNSLSWSDRFHGLKALQVLTEAREPSVVGLVRERALGTVLEMARWKTLDHALPAFVLAGRIAGISEEKVQDAWVRGDRESVLNEAAKRNK